MDDYQKAQEALDRKIDEMELEAMRARGIDTAGEHTLDAFNEKTARRSQRTADLMAALNDQLREERKKEIEGAREAARAEAMAAADAEIAEKYGMMEPKLEASFQSLAESLGLNKASS